MRTNFVLFLLCEVLFLIGCSWLRANETEVMTAAELAQDNAPMVCAALPKKRDREECLGALILVRQTVADVCAVVAPPAEVADPSGGVRASSSPPPSASPPSAEGPPSNGNGGSP